MGPHHRRRWRPLEGHYDAGTCEVCDEGWDSREERVREVVVQGATSVPARRAVNSTQPALRAQNKRPAAMPAFDLAGQRDYFLGAIASFAALATRNFTTVLALI